MASPDATRTAPVSAALVYAAAVALATGLLLAPALWNGFPLLQWDTGGYLARWYEGTLVVSRSTVYGGLLYLLQAPGFWPMVLLQAALATWTIALLLRTFGLARPLTILATVAVLAALTTLPWLASILITDVFAGLAVLAAYLLTFAWAQLSRLERGGLLALITIAVASHSATLLLILGLASAGLLYALIRPARLAPRRLAPAAASCAAGAALLVSCNYAVSGTVAWTPGGASILCARMMEDGIVQRFLAEQCAKRSFRLCRFRDQLPNNADEFLWGGGRNSIFNRLGRFTGLGPEMQAIALESIVLYPALQARSALWATARQLVTVDSGEGVVRHIPHTTGVIERFTPAWTNAMRAARQQAGDLPLFSTLNRIHVPVALGSVLALIGVAVRASRRGHLDALEILALTVLLAFFLNAAICGVFSNPHPRYGARIAWLAPLVVLMLAIRTLPAPPALTRVLTRR